LGWEAQFFFKIKSIMLQWNKYSDNHILATAVSRDGWQFEQRLNEIRDQMELTEESSVSLRETLAGMIFYFKVKLGTLGNQSPCSGNSSQWL
jgi:hypothetical protein